MHLRLNALFASIRTRLVILVLVAVLPAASLVLYGDLRQRHADEKSARREAVQVTQVMSEQYVDATERVRQLMGSLAALNLLADPQRCASSTGAIIQHFPQFMNLGVADLNGNVICSGLASPPGVNVSDRAYFQQVRATNEFSSGNFQIGKLTGKPSIGFGYPLRDEAGSLTGVMLATMDLTWMNQFLTKVEVPRDSVVTLFDKDGIVITRLPDPGQWVGQAAGDSELFKRIQPGSSGTFEARGLDSQQRLYAFASLGGVENPVYLTFGISTSVAFASANKDLTGSLVFLAFVAAVALLAAATFGDIFLLRGIRSLAVAARRLAAGDLSARSGHGHGTREVTELAQSFDDMASALEARQSESRRYQEDLTRKVAQLNALHGVFSKITERLSTHEVAQSALEQALELVDAEVVVLRLLKENSLQVVGTVTKTPAAVLDLRPVPLGVGLIGGVALTGKSVRFDRDVTDFMSPGQGIRGAQSGIAVPVMIHGKVLGTLGCWSLRRDAFPRDIEQILEMLASQIAAAIAAAEARDDSERLARVDALTGLPNRLQLSEDLHKLGQAAADHSLMFAMLDIDNFKQLNDNLGHLFGDVVLRRLGFVLKAALREDDHIYRFGGEEFLIIAPYTATESAVDMAERLRAIVAETQFEKRQDRPRIRVTISIGVAFAKIGETPDTTIDSADKALYQAKALGRNRVIVWDSQTTEQQAA